MIIVLTVGLLAACGSDDPKSGGTGESSGEAARVGAAPADDAATPNSGSVSDEVAEFLPPGEDDVDRPGSPGDLARAAEQLFDRARVAGVDMHDGPCLGFVATNWVADVAHEPRAAVDDRPENQCAEFGREAQHFVEVSPEGTAINIDGRPIELG